MANDVTQLGLVVGTAAFINVTYSVQRNRDPVPPLVASGIMYGGLAVFGQLSNRFELAIAFAWVFLIASLISRGIPMLQSATAAVTAKPPTNSANSGGAKEKGNNGATPGGGGGGRGR